jgi:hypothetical protein
VKSGAIFDYGIEKRVTITGFVRDRANNLFTLASFSFNAPNDPVITGVVVPGQAASGAIYVNTTSPISFSVMDDWAGVNS